MLRHGDVLLTDGNTRMAALVRRFTRSTWSHVSMYVGTLEEGPDPRCIVEADVAAGVRAVPLSEFKGQRVRILRPTCLDDTERRRLADWVVSRIGAEYDLDHALALGRRFLRLPLASRSPSAPSTMAQGATRFICSSLLAQAFVLVGMSDRPDADWRPRHSGGGPQIRHPTRFRKRARVRGGEGKAGRRALLDRASCQLP